MSLQLRQDITKYNLLLWQLRGATGGGQTDFVLQDKSDFVLQDKSDFVLQDKSDFFLTCTAFLMHSVHAQCALHTCYQVC